MSRCTGIFADAFDLTPSEAAVLSVLHRAGCAWVSTEAINERTAPVSSHYDHAAPLRHPSTVKAHIWSLRRKLGEESILAYWGRGYTLGADGVQKCRAALRDAAKAAA